MKKYILTISFFLLVFSVSSQNLSNYFVEKKTAKDSIELNKNLSFLSISLFDDNWQIIEKENYSLSADNNFVLLSKKYDFIYIVYKKKDEFLNKTFFYKDSSLIKKYTADNKQFDNYFLSSKNEEDKNSFSKSTELIKSGSISRGIMFGNNQNMSVNSNLNMHLSGKLSEKLSIRAFITDNNIPIQADGYSQHLQDFDKVFIELYSDKISLKAGDIEMNYNESAFMKVNKKLQGLNFDFLSKDSTKKIESSSFISLSKGKYCRKDFNGQNSNQGPYRLNGCNNETFIIVLAGSEKVYLNGELLKRGENYDFVIDYNTAEIIFTEKHFINNSDKISVEYEYSDKNYNRLLLSSFNRFENHRSSYFVNFYSESDLKSQPVNIDLDERKKEILTMAGDNPLEAIIENIDSLSYDADFVMYKKKDTTVNTTNYTIYEYSTDEDSANYRLGFSFLGAGNGNYNLIPSVANGKVYQWVAPIGDEMQGGYEPITILPAPKNHQFFNFGTKQKITEKSDISVEMAISSYDANSFSTINNSDNNGFALTSKFTQTILEKDSSLLKTNLSFAFVDKKFTKIERFKSIESKQNWNLENAGIYKKSNELLLNANFSFVRKNKLKSSLTTSLLRLENEYQAFKNVLILDYVHKNTKINTKSYFVRSTDKLNNANLFDSKIFVQQTFKPFNIGIDAYWRVNNWKEQLTDSLLLNSEYKLENSAFINNKNNQKKHFYELRYTKRHKLLPIENQMKITEESDEIELAYNLLKQKNHRLKLNIALRQTSYLNKKSIEQNSLSKLNHSINILKSAIKIRTIYQINSGQELKKDYSYIKVSEGQGAYTWNDYNENDVVELNEFEVAAYQDEANYIKVLIPTNEYEQTYNNNFSSVINFRLKPLLTNKKSLIYRNFSNFNNIFAFKSNNKTTDNNFEVFANPLLDKNKTSVLSASKNIRNHLSFNQQKNKYRIDYILIKSARKYLLTNGFEQNNRDKNELKLRLNIKKKYSVKNLFLVEEETKKSEYFKDKNYDIYKYSNRIEFSFQPNIHFNISSYAKFKDAKNRIGTEKLQEVSTGIKVKIAKANNYNLSAKLSLIKNSFSAENDYSTVSYIMMEGLQNGDNTVWTIDLQKKIAKIFQLSLIYNGRQSTDAKTIHNAKIEVKAIF